MTIPLQRFLRVPAPAYGTEEDLAFCWDLHVIDLRGCKSLLAVHCDSRYAFVRYDLSRAHWQDLPATFLVGLEETLSQAGVPRREIRSYLRRSGPPQVTRTHGRRPVAFLNRAWTQVLALDYCLDPDHHGQPLLDRAVNQQPSRCAGFPGLGTGAERQAMSLKRGR